MPIGLNCNAELMCQYIEVYALGARALPSLHTSTLLA
jgi:hypothetical protein